MGTIAYRALWLLVFVLPWENSVVIPGIGTISKVFGILAAGCTVLVTVMSGRMRRPEWFHFAAIMFVFWAGMSVFHASNEVRAVEKFKTYLQLILVIWMIWELGVDRKRLQGLMLAYICGAYVASLNTILVFRSEIGSNNRRFAAQGFDPNDLGMTLALALPIAWYLGTVYRQPLLRWVSRAYIPLGLFALALTGSRGALIATMVALTIIPLTLGRFSLGRFVAGFLVIGISGVVAIVYVPERSWERLGSTKSEVEVGTLNERVLIWRAGMRVFPNHPFIGYGANNFDNAVEPILGIARAPHNSYLALAVEQGMIGFAIYFFMVGTVVRRALSLPPLERRWALVELATLAVAMLPLGWDDRKPVWFILALIQAMSFIYISQPAAPAPAGRPGLPRRAPLQRRPVAS